MEYNGYALDRDNRGLFAIKPIGRGSVPKPLRGLFTSVKEAAKAIDSCQTSKEKTSGKAESSS